LASSERRILGVSLALVLGAAFGGCSFPDHTFIEDNQFYGTGAVGASSGSAGASGAGGSAGEGGGGTGGIGGGGTGGGGTGGTPGVEDCLNGLDDDGDGKIDCEDPDCQPTHTCVPPVPSGWQGPVAVYDGSGASPDCFESGGYPSIVVTANASFSPGTASCPTCACGSPTGASCAVDVFVYSNPDCTGTSWGPPATPTDPNPPTQTFTATGSCAFLPNLCQPPTPAGAGFTNLRVTGTCQAQTQGQKEIPAPTWAASVRACGDVSLSGKGCGTSNSACVPKPASPFKGSPCIHQTGDVACPSGAYSKKTVYYQSFTDSRDCSPCACGTNLSGASCTNATLKLYTNDSCSANEQTLNSTNTCVALAVDADPLTSYQPCVNIGGNGIADTRAGIFTGTPSASGAQCPATGGVLTGQAAASQPVTFCCL
jgi:hypothetical protein